MKGIVNDECVIYKFEIFGDSYMSNHFRYNFTYIEEINTDDIPKHSDNFFEFYGDSHVASVLKLNDLAWIINKVKVRCLNITK